MNAAAEYQLLLAVLERAARGGCCLSEGQIRAIGEHVENCYHKIGAETACLVIRDLREHGMLWPEEIRKELTL